MGTVASNKGNGDFPVLESGTYAARCYGVIDIGTQRGEFQGKELKKHQVILLFETPDELLDDGRPFGLSSFRTLSLSDKATLRHELEAWRGRPFTDVELEGFDIANLIGAPCMLTITVTDKGKNKIVGVGKPMKGLSIKEASNPEVHFDLDKYLARNMDEVEKYNSLPDWIKNKIRDSEEVKFGPSCNEPTPPDTRGDDEIDEEGLPF